MPRFNFNEITKSGKADIDLIGQNFQEIEEKGITEAEVDEKVGQDNYIFKRKTYNMPSSVSAFTGNCFIDVYRRGKIVIMNLNHNIGGNTSGVYLGQFILNFNDFEDWFKPSVQSGDGAALYQIVSSNCHISSNDPNPNEAIATTTLETIINNNALTDCSIYIKYYLPTSQSNDEDEVNYKFMTTLIYAVD